MRVIMSKTPSSAERSINVMRRQRKVSEFLKRELPRLPSMEKDEAVAAINRFVKDFDALRVAEEKVVFPESLKASKK